MRSRDDESLLLLLLLLHRASLLLCFKFLSFSMGTIEIDTNFDERSAALTREQQQQHKRRLRRRDFCCDFDESRRREGGAAASLFARLLQPYSSSLVFVKVFFLFLGDIKTTRQLRQKIPPLFLKTHSPVF